MRDYPRDVLTTFHYIPEFNLCVVFVAPFVDCRQLHLHLNFKPYVSAYTASRGINLKFPVSSARVPHRETSKILTVRWESDIGVMQT